MERGTILYVGNFELPDKGASANRVMANRKLFQALGYRVIMLGVTKERSSGLEVSSYDGEIYEEACPTSVLAWAEHMLSVKNIEAVVSGESDVQMILLYNAPYALYKRCCRRFRKRNIRVCYDCTEWTTVTDGGFAKRLVKKWDGTLIRRKLGKKADGLIVISRRMEQAYGNVKNLLLLPPLVDEASPIWHQQPKGNEGKFEFCFAGMLDGSKDSLDKIVEAFSCIRRQNVLLRIIGVSKEEFQSHYPDKIDFISDSVVFMGRKSHEETVAYVLGCGCYIFIRQSDLRNNAGFPTKFVEAYTSGCPLIASNISDIAPYMQDNSRGILLESMEISEIAGAMEEILAHREQYQSRSLDETFHYMNYCSAAERWLEGITG